MQRKASYESLLKRFLSGVEKTKNVDYLDKQSIRRNNAGVDQYRKAAKQIGEMYPEHIEDFSSLLDCGDSKEKICCGICMIELMECSKEQNSHAYSVLKEHYDTSMNGAEKMMFEVWFQKYTSKFS